MLDNLLFSLNNTVPLFCLMLLGYFLQHRGFFSDRFVADANKFVFHIALPVLLFEDLAQTDVRAVFDARFVLFCALTTLAAILVIWVLARRLIPDKAVVGEFVQASYRSSAAILGVAFVQLIYGEGGAAGSMSGLMILGAVPLYNIFAVLILALESPAAAERALPLAPRLKASLGRIARNPIILGILIGFVFGFCRIPVPAVIGSVLTPLGRMTTPLALLAIGAGFRGRAALFTAIVCAMALPKQVILIPLLKLMAFLGIHDTLWAVVLPTVGWPFGVFLLKQFSEGIPTEMMEAARIDGAGETRTFLSIIVPMIKPGIGALAVESAKYHDYNLLMLIVLLTGALVILTSLAAETINECIDPRMRVQEAALWKKTSRTL